MDKWILVVDDDAVSRRQMEVCRAVRPGLKGFVDCSEEENRDAPICAAVDAFPAFCDEERSACVYGFRGTAEELAALQTNQASGAAPSASST